MGRKDLEQMTVSEDMEEELFQKIQDYEYEKRTKVVYRKKKNGMQYLFLRLFLLLYLEV